MLTNRQHLFEGNQRKIENIQQVKCVVFSMKVQFSIGLSILLSNAQWKWGVKNGLVWLAS